MASNEITLRVNLVVELDGEPITRMMEMPGTYELGRGPTPLTINLHLDGKKLAKALLPHLTSLVRSSTGMRGF